MRPGTTRRRSLGAGRPHEKPPLRPVLLGVLAGVAVLVVGMVGLHLVMRTLGLEYGGACASGGPYEIRPGQECESGIFASAYASIFGLVAGALLLWWSSNRYGGTLVVTSAVGASCAVFFGGLGGSFLRVAAEMPAGADGISDFKAVGVTFVVLAVLGLAAPVAWVVHTARGDRKDMARPTSSEWLAWLASAGAGAATGAVVAVIVLRAS